MLIETKEDFDTFLNTNNLQELKKRVRDKYPDIEVMDYIQEAILNTYTRLSKGSVISNPLGYLYISSINLIINYYSSKEVQHCSIGDKFIEEKEEDDFDTINNASIYYVIHNTNLLTEKERNLVLARLFDKLSMKRLIKENYIINRLDFYDTMNVIANKIKNHFIATKHLKEIKTIKGKL